MRTAIFLGLTCVADAIRKDWLTDQKSIQMSATLLILFFLMDVIDFFASHLKSK